MQPARYEVAAVRRPESVTGSFYYQTLLGWRIVSLGGEAAFVRRPTDAAPDANKLVLRVGGMWQVRAGSLPVPAQTFQTTPN